MNRRLWFAFGFLAVANSATCYGVRCVSRLDAMGIYSRDFDTSVWNDPESPGPWMTCDNERGAMVGSIIRRELGSAPTRTQVIALLGTPDWQGPAEIRYSLGCSKLRFTFDADEGLVRASVIPP